MFSAAVWTGVLKSAYNAPFLRQTPITLLPAFGLLLVMAGMSGEGWLSGRSPIALLGALLIVAGFVLFFVNPRWWGPRWWRERRRESER